MADNKKARPVVAATGQAGENRGCVPQYPRHNDTTAHLDKQSLLEDILPHGSQNAILAAQLTVMLGLKNARSLRSLVSSARDNGRLVLSGNKGYFLPSEGEAGRPELVHFERLMRARAFHSLRAAKAAHRALQQLSGQLSISDQALPEQQEHTAST